MEKLVLNSKKNDAVIIAMDSCKDLGEGIQKHLEDRMDKITAKFMKFGNNEINTFPADSVREKTVFIIGSGSNSGGTINDNLMAMLAMTRACRDASAKHITVMSTYLSYSRSDKKDQGRAPIMAKLICDFFKTAGAQRLISVDLHASQIQGFFDGPFDNLYAIDYLIAAIKKDFSDQNLILLSPDLGGEKRILNWSQKLGLEYTCMTKSRDHNKISTIAKQELVHKDIDLIGKNVLIVDDMFDTGGTMCNAAKILKEKGAVKVIAVITHGIFSGKAFENLAKDDLDIVYTTNTLPQSENMAKSAKIKLVDMSELCAQAIECCVNGTSMSSLFY